MHIDSSRFCKKFDFTMLMLLEMAISHECLVLKSVNTRCQSEGWGHNWIASLLICIAPLVCLALYRQCHRGQIPRPNSQKGLHAFNLPWVTSVTILSG